MKSLFDKVSRDCSKTVTQNYSTSFSLASKMLGPTIRQDIHNIYGFVRFADEIVDTFHNFDKRSLLDRFEKDLLSAVEEKISLNPILNSFQETVNKYDITPDMYGAFMHSMRLDLDKSVYLTDEEYRNYIYGSADVVGLMSLKVFVKGNMELYNDLKDDAMRLGSAFQKVNFLRDLKADLDTLERSYFPNTDLHDLSEEDKARLIAEIKEDFDAGLRGIQRLPIEAKLGVYTAYTYYRRLLTRLERTPSKEIRNTRIRVPNYEKIFLLSKGYVTYRLNLI
ncbi:phytoene synthase [Nonlabens sp. MB-3u-79]|jgi:phytoene synthase|uniref:phytoene/squalene synthase family protein n=1 Tax=Nonlabens sp. MB-3u-79 TaxID=2058134 RepID=UPI000C318835|nr:phytoene/squalene synthase family protein [Nonlabens sp. MB-3u-79]AUC79361.1 phytoene synthase [Nonlabens sp. MB-3u-79]|tara:strand:+ start:5268 stop:6107 length:840 start_codon:yes stop_codon:yes gene_type:complete